MLNGKKIKSAVKKFTRFNNKAPRALVSREIDFSKPFVRIGKVPVITYQSDKTGKVKNYAHETNPARMPVLYKHPTKPIFLMLGGSVKMDRWLED